MAAATDTATFSTSTLSTASHSITAKYADDVNFNPSTSAAITQTVSKASTTTTVTSGTNPSVSGQPVTFTATVSIASPGTNAVGNPGGTVTFYDNGVSIGTGTLSGTGIDTATFTTSALSTASHPIAAQYTSGDTNFNASAASASFNQVVNKDTTTTTVSSSASSSSFGQTVTFTATVTANSPGSGTPTGSVDFYDNTTMTDLTPGGVLLSSGTATFSTSSLPVGSNVITVAYSGDSNFVSSSGTATPVTVNPSIIVLDPTAGGALTLSGQASIKVGGGIYVYSSNSTNALSASGNASATTSTIQVVGHVQRSGNASLSPAPTTGVTALADPLATLPLPSTTGLTNYGSVNVSGSSSRTISPGIFSQITVSGNASLTFNPGIYIIEGGGLTVSGGASVTGSGVTIYNGGTNYTPPASDGGNFGAITFSGNGTVNLTAPTSGTYAGILIFQARNNPHAITVSGNATVMSGTIYASGAQLVESGSAQLNGSLDVDTLTISGNATTTGVTLVPPSGTVAYTPAQIRSAYGITNVSQDGQGQTIAIVAAYNDPSIYTALDTFDSQFGLTASGPTLYQQYGAAGSFLTVLNQTGKSSPMPATDPNAHPAADGIGNDDWEVEESLNVEWAHAIAPGAKIILVEANSQSLADLMAAVATAAHRSGVSVVSMSWGFPEGTSVSSSTEATYDSVLTTPGVTFVASTGDYGATDPQYPAFSPNVVAVGGTTLTLNADNSYNSETGFGYSTATTWGAFIGSGGGISQYETEPAYQKGVQSLGKRTTPDVALFADPDHTGAWVADPYDLPATNPFQVVGGTSLSAPAWAGLIALANQGRVAAGAKVLNSSSPTEADQALYILPQSDYNVISTGNNGYQANSGYNLVTGLGTPVANLLVHDLIAYHGPGTTYSGPSNDRRYLAEFDPKPQLAGSRRYDRCVQFLHGAEQRVRVRPGFGSRQCRRLARVRDDGPGHDRPGDDHARPQCRRLLSSRAPSDRGRIQRGSRQHVLLGERERRAPPGSEPQFGRPDAPVIGRSHKHRGWPRWSPVERRLVHPGHDRPPAAGRGNPAVRRVDGAAVGSDPDRSGALRRHSTGRSGERPRPRPGRTADRPGGRFGAGRAGL